MSDVMMLCKDYTPRKMKYPCAVSQKLDGVPGVYSTDKMVSRQNKPLHGVQHLHRELSGHIPSDLVIVGEHYKPGLTFKEISGFCRNGNKWDDAELFLFDCYVKGNLRESFKSRFQYLQIWYSYLSRDLKKKIHIIPQTICVTEVQVDKLISDYHRPGIEGLIIRPLEAGYELTRSWGCQKKVYEDIIDLKVIGVEEGKGTLSGAIGAFICEYPGRAPEKVGAGKMSHDDRRYYFKNQQLVLGRFIKVKHKPDASYDSLRQATFQDFNDFKTGNDV